jgi:ABC-type multidrug transport system ATPase subunit
MNLELENVHKNFGRVEALSAVSASAPSGARLALIGPNGSGKSTLLRAILGLVAVRGKLAVGGFDPLGERHKLARRMVYVPQIAPRLAIPVRECVRVLSAVRGASVARTMEVASELDLDLRAVERRQVRELSGGMRQKLLVAVALAAPAEFVVLDEPTASLDASPRQRFYRLLDAHTRGATVVLCSHRLEEVRQVTSSVWALSEGRLHFNGSTTAYLHRAATASIELRLRNPEAAGPLGFLQGESGLWSAVVPHHMKSEVVRGIAAVYGPELLDLSVRDVESVALGDRPSKEKPYV